MKSSEEPFPTNIISHDGVLLLEQRRVSALNYFFGTSFSNIVSSSSNPPIDYAFPNMPPKVIYPPLRVATNIFTFNLSSSDDYRKHY